MKRTLTPREWFNTYVNKEKLLKDIVNAIDEAVQNDSTDYDGENYLGLVHDIVGGANGHYIPFFALQYFDYKGIDTDNIDKYNLVEALDELDSFTYELENIINDTVVQDTGIDVFFGYWEADNSYCMMATINKDDYNHLKDKFSVLNGDSNAEM